MVHQQDGSGGLAQRLQIVSGRVTSEGKEPPQACKDSDPKKCGGRLVLVLGYRVGCREGLPANLCVSRKLGIGAGGDLEALGSRG